MLLKFKPFFYLLFTSLVSITPSAYGGTTESIRKSGDALQIAVPLVAYGLTFYHEDSEGRLPFYKSFTASLLTTQALKFAVNAERPNGGDHSFPSGHTSAAFHGASFIHARYGLSDALPAYAAATLVGYSRVVSNRHYTRDVVAGALIGVGSSFYFTDPYTKTSKISMIPVMTSQYHGVHFVRFW